ncbi:MAG: hypothetical protein ACKOXF_01220 [Chitinophagaceae bacterium]
MKKLILALSLCLIASSAYCSSDDSSVFKPGIFVQAGLSYNFYNQNVLNANTNPYLDVEYAVSPTLSPVFHYSRINGFTTHAYIPRMILYTGPSQQIPVDTIYNINETEKLRINCFTLKLKFALTKPGKNYAYLSPQLGFSFVNSSLTQQGDNMTIAYKSLETYYSYGCDFGTDHNISTDGKLRLCTGLGILVGNNDSKDEYNYTSKIDKRLVIYNVSIGLKYLLYTAN